MSGPATLPALEPEVDFDTRRKVQPPYHVILLNDDDHSYLYVVAMLKQLFGHPIEAGWKMAEKVDKEGRCIVLTTTREHAELKQEQIHAFGPGPDHRAVQRLNVGRHRAGRVRWLFRSQPDARARGGGVLGKESGSSPR